jgi:hypothetical protein
MLYIHREYKINEGIISLHLDWEIMSIHIVTCMEWAIGGVWIGNWTY